MTVSNSNSGAKDYEEVQNKTFCKWLNARLVPKGFEPLTDLGTDFCDGIRLIQLIGVLTETPFRRYNKSSSLLKVQKAENLNLALDKIKEMGVHLTNIGAEDIMEGNRKLILGMIWSLVLRFVIADINEEGSHAKEGLLLWCQRKTTGYEEVDISNFTKSWQDGLAFCALIHRHRPDLLDYASLPKDDSLTTSAHNTKLAFQIAERHLGIPQLLEVEDICGAKRPDDRSVMTYVAQFFHAFSSKAQADTNARVINSFVERVDSLMRGCTEYEARAESFLQRIADILHAFSTSPIPSLPDARTSSAFPVYQSLRQSQTEFTTYAKGRKALETERVDLKMLLRNIQVKLGCYSLRSYDPPEELAFEALDGRWRELRSVEKKRSGLINSSIRQLRLDRAALLDDLVEGASAHLETLHLRLVSIVATSLDDQLASVQNLLTSIQAPNNLHTIEEVERDCRACEVAPEEFSTSFEGYTDLLARMEKLSKLAKLKENLLENQITARTQTNVTPEQLEEFESAFKAFDKDASNSLDIDELSGALGSLGFEESSHESIYNRIASSTDRVNFDSFLNFLVEKTEDRLTFDKVKDCFSNLAQDKPYITEIDITRVNLEPSTLEFFKEYMPTLSDADEEQYRAAMNGHANGVVEGEEDKGEKFDYSTFLERFFE